MINFVNHASLGTVLTILGILFTAAGGIFNYFEKIKTEQQTKNYRMNMLRILEPNLVLTQAKENNGNIEVFLKNVGGGNAINVEAEYSYSLPVGNGSKEIIQLFPKDATVKLSPKMFPLQSLLNNSINKGLKLSDDLKEYEKYLNEFNSSRKAIILDVKITYEYRNIKREATNYSVMYMLNPSSKKVEINITPN